MALDASSITNFSATRPELEELFLFWICAAGKNGTVATRLLDQFLQDIGGQQEPFETIASLGYDSLVEALRNVGIGCYTRKAKTMFVAATSGLDLRRCTLEELEAIPGIGPKTSRCFVLHSRPNTRVAALDTHILKYLREQGFDAPKSTPSSKKKYADLEKAFLSLADKAGVPVAEFDLAIWKQYAQR